MDFLKVVVIILYILLTIVTIKIHPKIHQPMVLEDADFQLVRISDTISKENIPIVTVKPQEIKQPVTQEPVKTVEIKDIKVSPTQTKTVQTTQIPVETKPVKIKLPKKEVPIQTSTPGPSQAELLQRLLNTDIEDTKALQENAEKLAKTIQQKPQQVQKPVQKPVQTSANKNPYMTEQEELIAWNKWRSNIHNQIMKDSNAGVAPFGTLFTFSFLVDKYGNVSNVKVSCSNNFCMEIARNNLKPAISNLQRKPILNFPRGTQRTSTVVNGSFMIGSEDRFSTPSNFSDIERVVH